MFPLHSLKGNTYYISAPTNIGVYMLNKKDCILIDTCLAGSMTDRLLATLAHYHLTVKAILNTHAHVDHFGSNWRIKTKYGSMIAVPPIENHIIERPGLSNLFIFNAAPLSNTKQYYPKGVKVDLILDGDSHIIEDTLFRFISLKGHCLNQIGIITPDNVIFVGDAFLGKESLDEVKLLYNYDTHSAIASMHALSSTHYFLYVPSHGKPLEEIEDTIKYNIDYIKEKAYLLYRLLEKQPLSIDEMMGVIVSQFRVTEQIPQYFIAQSCITSLLSYMENSGTVKPCFENGIIKFGVV